MSSVRDNIGPEWHEQAQRRLNLPQVPTIATADTPRASPDHGGINMTDERVRHIVLQELIRLGVVLDKTGDI